MRIDIIFSFLFLPLISASLNIQRLTNTTELEYNIHLGETK
jgi:hypothetical protein